VDLGSLATSLVEAERAAREQSVNSNITKGENRISGYSAMLASLNTVTTAFTDIQKPSLVNLLTAASSNSGAVSVTTTNGATPGAHDIDVISRAQAQRNLSQGFAAADTQLNGGAGFMLKLTVNGSTKGINIPAANTTPAGMVTVINNAKLGVTAQLINTGDGSTASYKIVLTGATGASNAFSLATDDNSGTAEQQKITFRATASASASITVAGVTVAVAAGDTPTAVAAKTKSALEANDTKNKITSRTYTDNGDGSLSVSYAKSDGDMPLLTAIDTGGTGISPIVTQVQNYVSGAPLAPLATKQQKLSFGAATSDGTISVGGVSVSVTAGETAAAIASRVQSVLAADASMSGRTLTDNADGSMTVTYSAADADTSGLAFDAGNSGVTSSKATTRAYSSLDSWSSLQPAGDASLKIDGVLISRTSNTVTDAIVGVTLNLTGTTTTNNPAVVSLTRDTSALKEKLKTLVTSFNNAISDFGVLTGPKNTTDTTDVYSGSLQNDSTVQTVKSQLRGLFLNNSSTPGKSFTALRDIGVTIDKTGVLSLDETKFDSAASTNFDDIVTILTNNSESKSQYTSLPQGLAGDAVKRLTDLTKATGFIQTQASSTQKNVDRYKAELEQIETRLTALKAQYTKSFASLDSLVGSINSEKASLTATFNAMNNTTTK
jgi:flagellar hook-associated protein 2